MDFVTYVMYVIRGDVEDLVNHGNDDAAMLSNSAAATESVAGILYRQGQASSEATPPRVQRNEPMTEAQKVERLVFYESLFFLLDQDASMYIERDECDALLSFTAVAIDPETRDAIMDKHDKTKDGRLSRSEFCMLCVENLWDVPFAVMERAVQNLQKAKVSVRTRNKVYWGAVSDRVDSFARLGVPSLYILALIIVFHIDLRDEYDKAETVGMFAGINRLSSLKPTGGAFIGGYCAVLLLIAIFWWLARSAAHKAEEKKKRDFFMEARNAAQSLSTSSNELMTNIYQRAKASAEEGAKSPKRENTRTRSRKAFEIETPSGINQKSQTVPQTDVEVVLSIAPGLGAADDAHDASGGTKTAVSNVKLASPIIYGKARSFRTTNANDEAPSIAKPPGSPLRRSDSMPRSPLRGAATAQVQRADSMPRSPVAKPGYLRGAAAIAAAEMDEDVGELALMASEEQLLGLNDAAVRAAPTNLTRFGAARDVDDLKI